MQKGERDGEGENHERGEREGSLPLSPQSPSLFTFSLYPLPLSTPATQAKDSITNANVSHMQELPEKRSNLAAEAQVCGNPDVCVSPLLSECTSKLELRVKQHY